MDMQAYSRQNSGMKYILCVIDVFSKYAWAVGMKTKKAQDVTAAFRKILTESRGTASVGPPRNLQTDQGLEFFNKIFDALCKREGINHYHTYSVMKASIVECFNRTLKELLWRHFSLQGTH